MKNETKVVYLTISTQDSELLRTATGNSQTQKDNLGIKQTEDLAQLALQMVCRAVLRQGYVPAVITAVIGNGSLIAQAPLPKNVIRVEF
jgi:hypothetical protein